MKSFDELINIAKQARGSAYAPYSGFSVGAALLCEDGSIYSGCNIESASYTPTCCAERVAIFKAVSEGKRGFVAVAVTGGKEGEASEPCYPCGVCRQVLSEFCGGDLRVILQQEDGEPLVTDLASLLPHRFER